MQKLMRPAALTASLALLSGAGTLSAADFPIGDPVVKNGMQIAAVYIQPTKMAPMLPGMMKPSDIHLEADIHAVKKNPNGLAKATGCPTYRSLIASIR